MALIDGYYDVREIKQDEVIELSADDQVLGFSVECPADSTSDASIQLNGSPKLPLNAGDPARPFGGFYACDPVILKDQIKVTFNTAATANPRVLLIILRIKC